MKKDYLALFFLFIVCCAFFYKSIFFGLVPIPGDLLIGEYGPWKTYSYLGYVPGSFPNKAQYFDVLRQLYPWKTLVVDSIKNGIFPLWNPYNFSGTPLFANFQSAVLYPFNFLYFFFPQILAWSILVFLQPLFACIWTYLYARKIGLQIWGALFAAVSFGFSSFFSVWLEYNTMGHVISFLPLALFSIEKFLSEKKIRYLFLCIFSLVSSSLGGHIQLYAYLFFFVGIYIFFRAKSLRIPFPSVLFFSMFLSIGLASIQLLPGFELIFFAARNPHPYTEMVEKILIQPWQLIMFVVPDFFGNPATRNYWIQDTYIGKVTSIGLVAFVFLLYSFLKKKPFFFRFFGLTALVILLFVTRNPLTEILYSFSIPFISSSAPTLGVFLFCFSLSILAGCGVDVVCLEKKQKNLFLPLYVIAGIIGILWIVVLFSRMGLIPWKEVFSIGIKPMLYETILFGIAAVLLGIGFFRKQTMYVVIILLVLVQTADLFHFFQKFNPFSPPETVFPKADVLTVLQKSAGVNRFWGYGAATIEANFATQYSLFSPDGYDPLYPRWYGLFLPSTRDGKLLKTFTPQTRSDAVVAQGYGEDNFTNTYRDRVLDTLGVLYILDRDANALTEKSFTSDRYKLIYQKEGWKIFENKKSLPRAFFVSDYRVVNTSQEFEKEFFSNSFYPKETVLLSEDPSIPALVSGEATIVSYVSNKVVIKTNGMSKGMLVLTDTYYPGWKAEIDGKETHIYKADYVFRGVIVPAGKHTITFTFSPMSFKIGILLSTLSLSGICFWFVFWKKRIV